MNDTTSASIIESWVDYIAIGQQDNHTTNISNPHAVTHAQLSDKGANTHAQIDSFIANYDDRYKTWEDHFETLDLNIWTSTSQSTPTMNATDPGVNLADTMLVGFSSIEAYKVKVNLARPFIMDFSVKLNMINGNNLNVGLRSDTAPNMIEFAMYTDNTVHWRHYDTSNTLQDDIILDGESAYMPANGVFHLFRITSDGTTITMTMYDGTSKRAITAGTIAVSVIRSASSLWYTSFYVDGQSSVRVEYVIRGNGMVFTGSPLSLHKGTKTHAEIDTFISSYTSLPTTTYSEKEDFYAAPSRWTESKPSGSAITYDATLSGSALLEATSITTTPAGLKRTQNFLTSNKDWECYWRVKPVTVGVNTKWVIGMQWASAIDTTLANSIVVTATGSSGTLHLQAPGAIDMNSGLTYSTSLFYWFRFVRKNGYVTVHRSTDGITWTQIGSVDVTLLGAPNTPVAYLVSSNGSATAGSMILDTCIVSCNL